MNVITSYSIHYTKLYDLSRVFYSIMTFFVDIISVGMIAISVNWTLRFSYNFV